MTPVTLRSRDVIIRSRDVIIRSNVTVARQRDVTTSRLLGNIT